MPIPPSLKELEEAAQPLIKLLRDKYTYHTQIIIDGSRIKLLDERLGIPYNYFEEEGK